MIDNVVDFQRGFEKSAYPSDFLAAYEPLKCLSHTANGETLIVRGRADDELYIAKALPEGASDEGAILEKLSHPALPRFVARFEEAGRRILVREYAEGLPLDEAADGHPLSEAEAVYIGVQLCDALTYLHTQTPPVIHRDLKPQNVILARDGAVKLIDFGISRFYKENAKHDTVFSGTNNFAPPEQYGFAQTDARADIYALGVLLKYLLTGGNPEGEVENPRLRRVIKRCTAFSPKARYASAARVKRALLADSPKHLRRNAAVLAACTLLLGVGIGRFAIPWVEGEIAKARTAASEIAQEYARANAYGFIPETLVNQNPDETAVTWRQYCTMLGSVIAACNQALVPKWEEMTAAAPDTSMRRDGGMVSLLFAGEVMGLDRFNAAPPDCFLAYAPEVWKRVTMDYPVFDWNRYKMIDSGCYDNNYVGPAYDYCVRRVSNVTNKPLLEFNREGNLRLEQPFTLREAALSALRLYESAS